MRHGLHLDPGLVCACHCRSSTRPLPTSYSRQPHYTPATGKGPARVKLVSLVRARPAGRVGPAGSSTQARPRDRVRYCADMYIIY